MATTPATYNKQQWIDSFESRMLRLRPHMTSRQLATVAISSWQRYGTKNVDPVKAADEVSSAMDHQNGKP